MRHVHPLSRTRRPIPAMSLLEKEAIYQSLQELIAQLGAFVSIVQSVKNLQA